MCSLSADTTVCGDECIAKSRDLLTCRIPWTKKGPGLLICLIQEFTLLTLLQFFVLPPELYKSVGRFKKNRWECYRCLCTHTQHNLDLYEKESQRELNHIRLSLSNVIIVCNINTYISIIFTRMGNYLFSVLNSNWI